MVRIGILCMAYGTRYTVLYTLYTAHARDGRELGASWVRLKEEAEK